MTTYRIVNWDTTYENNRSRELKETDWFPCPNKLDGDGFCTMIEGKDGPLAYCGWILLLAVASRCNPRGTLIQTTGQPHTSRSIATKAHVSVRVVEVAITRALAIRWLEKVPDDPAGGCDLGATKPQAGAGLVRPLPREQNGKGKGIHHHHHQQGVSVSTARDATPENGGGGGGDVVLLTPKQIECYELIVRRPAWLPENGAWIDPVRSRDLACLPTTSPALIAQAVKEARQKRSTLSNPAGLVITRLSKPDPGLLGAIAAQESNA